MNQNDYDQVYKRFMVINNFISNLRNLMDANGIDSVVSLAKKVSIPRGRINNWIARSTIAQPEDLEILARFFKVEPYYFLMTPGSQGDVKPTQRHDDFKTLLDDLAVKCLTEIELASYKEMGPEEFVRVLRINYESDHILPVRWCLKLNAELKKYVSVNLEEKLRSNLAAQDAKKA